MTIEKLDDFPSEDIVWKKINEIIDWINAHEKTDGVSTDELSNEMQETGNKPSLDGSSNAVEPRPHILKNEMIISEETYNSIIKAVEEQAKNQTLDEVLNQWDNVNYSFAGQDANDEFNDWLTSKRAEMREGKK